MKFLCAALDGGAYKAKTLAVLSGMLSTEQHIFALPGPCPKFKLRCAREAHSCSQQGDGVLLLLLLHCYREIYQHSESK